MDKRGAYEKLRLVLDASIVAKWVISGGPWDKEARLVEERERIES